jgi:hypothetical protein
MSTYEIWNMQLKREPQRHLGMSRGDERCACGRTLCLRSGSRFTENKSQKEPKTYLILGITNKPTNQGLPFQLMHFYSYVTYFEGETYTSYVHDSLLFIRALKNTAQA